LAHPPDHDGVLAAVDYGPIARRLVLRLKYGRKPQFAHVMARLMARHAAAYPDALLIPVPLHWTRLWQRGFNQSLLIARCVASHTGQLVHPQALVRTRRTRPLSRLSQKDRAIEVRGVFRLANGFGSLVQGKDVLLVDDVYTSGATANACAKLLKRNGAQSVRILCWARVVIDAP
jgi:ComF family protein